MSRTVVCYLERAAGGSLIRRVRLVGEGGPTGLDRTWTAPSLSVGGSGAGGVGEGEGGGGGGGGGGSSNEAVNHTRAAARWVADTLGTLGTKRLAMLCLDPDGSLCTWLSAPSADPTVIQATLAQPDTEGDVGGGGAARLLALGAGSSGGFGAGDASLQALATMERPSGRGRSRAAETGKKRLAVLAVPDVPVRVFLDELDSRGVEVDQVISLWHALAMAWDPSRPEPGEQSAERVVATVSPAAAIVAVDPLGRLVWAWSQSGQLVAGGQMRLRTIAGSTPDPSPVGDELAEAGGTGGGEGAARRVETGEVSRAPSAVEFTVADTGRLVLDWLSWSAQLGHCPQRVACLGPAPVAGVDTLPDPGLVGRSLGEAWPSATVGVAVHDDPVGATLHRLLTHDIVREHRRAAELEVATGSDDPRASLVALSARPGRVDRRMHTWAAVGVAAIAVVVGAVGWKFHAAAVRADQSIEEANERRRDALESMKGQVAGIQASTNPRQDLQNEIDRLTKQNNAIKAPRPLLTEMAALLNAIAGHDEVKIDRFDLNPITGIVNLRVPDAETGPRILEQIKKLPMFMKWDGSTPGGGEGMNPGGERRYNLQGLATAGGGR